MQTFEELTRPFPDASQLASLRARVLSDEPEEALDLALHQEFYSSAMLVEVEASLTYQVPDQPEYKVKGPKWLWSRGDRDWLGR